MTTEMTTLHRTSPLAWRFTTCTPTSTFTECAHARIVSSASYVSSILTLAQVRALSALHSRPSTCHPCVRSLHLDLHSLLPSLPAVPVPLPFLFLTNKKSMANLYNSAKEGVGTTDVLSFPTGYEPKAHDFYELLNSPALLSYMTPTADQDYDDSTLEDMLHRAHRAQVDHSAREDLSVSLSSSSMSDRTGQPVGDRPWQPGDHRSSEAQIRTLLDEQKQKVLAECQNKNQSTRISSSSSRRKATTPSRTTMAAKVGIS